MLFASSAARTAALVAPSQGMRSYLTDSNSAWQYYEAYNSSTNPGGAATAGWYPAEGTVLFAGKRSNTGQSMTNNAYTRVSFNTFVCTGSTSNTDTIQLDSATAPSAFTVRINGWYSISLIVSLAGFASTAGTLRQMTMSVNQTTQSPAILFDTSSTPTATSFLRSSTSLFLAAGDVVRFWIYHDAGAATTCNNTNATITYLRPAGV